mgnify:CR=1 FL=1
MNLQPAHQNYNAMVRESFVKQGLMGHIDAELTAVEPGFTEIRLPYRNSVSQQHGLFHGGVTASILDSAGGYAAYSLFEVGDGILTVEFKVNLIAPAMGDELIARAEVIKPGKSLSVARGEAFVVKDGREKSCAIMQQTLMRIVGRPDIAG